MSEIRTQDFCYLSTSPQWLNWLQATFPEYYEDLSTHLKTSKSCGSNRQKMMQLLSEMLKNKQTSGALLAFLRKHYPYIVQDDTEQHVQTSKTISDNEHNVFEHYDPSLRTYPQRIILVGTEGTEIEKLVQNWCRDKAVCDHIILGDRAYVEYLTMGQKHLKDKIPQSNWQLERYRRKAK